LQNAARRQLQQRQQQLAYLSQRLHTVSPLATLDRGYAIASAAEHAVLQSVKPVNSGDTIHVRLSDGTLDCQVTTITANTNQKDIA